MRTTDQAHPRSRGENPGQVLKIEVATGSSPLTRGKLKALADKCLNGRLIPAHAGKTGIEEATAKLKAAHPRSRGENFGVEEDSGLIDGSSPLTRGKPGVPQGQSGLEGLIPAHAGKTLPDLRFYCADRSDLGNP